MGGVLAAGGPFCLVMAESADAVAKLDATLAVDGVDGLYVGPGDLSLSLGCEPDPDDPVLNEVLQRVWAACAAAGKPVGVHAANGTLARRYRDGRLYPHHVCRRCDRDRPRHRRPVRSRPGLSARSGDWMKPPNGASIQADSPVRGEIASRRDEGC